MQMHICIHICTSRVMHICIYAEVKKPLNAHMHFENVHICIFAEVRDGMPRRIDLTEDKKLRIADLYHNSNLSVGSIAEREDVSLRTVHNYKDYDYFQQPDNVSEENMQHPDQTIEEYPEKKCPDCGTTKSEWVLLEQAEEYGIAVPTEEELEKYDYICPNCSELIKTSDK